MIKIITPILILVGTLHLAFAENLPSKNDVIKHGYFRFPQAKATIICDNAQLRLSAFNNETLLYIQAIIWNDDSNEIGADKEDRQFGDSSTLYMDIDADLSVTPDLDRCYCLDPQLSLTGLYYHIFQGKPSMSCLNGTKGTGNICYLNFKGGKTIRIDNYVIPLKELSRKVGDKIRFAYEATSAIPQFTVSTFSNVKKSENHCCDVPMKAYNTFVLKKGVPLTFDQITDNWSEETVAFTKSKPVDNSNQGWFSTTNVFHSHDWHTIHGVPLTDPNEIQRELEEPNFIETVGKYLNLNPRDVSKIQLKQNEYDYTFLDLHQRGAPPSVFDVVTKAIEQYVDIRQNGHTKKYAHASLKRDWKTTDINDVTLKALINEYPDVPPAWLQKEKDEMVECRDGKKIREVLYAVIDNKIAWVYRMQFDPNGSLVFHWCDRNDAKEYDPKYKQIFAEVDKQVNQQMKKEGVRGSGSCHYFWQLKKNILKEKGIEWKSPPDLNPGACYD